jgi:hypothetical protein
VAPAQTISDGSLLEQIPGGAPAWKDAAEGGVTFVITPGPWTNLSAAEERQRGRVSNLKEVSKDSTAEKVFEDDVELIHFNGKGYDSLVARLAERAPNKGRVVILCGDVHFAFASRTQYWSKTKNPLDPGSANTPNSAVFAQMLASAFKNQGNPIIFSSLALHHAGFRLSKRDMMRVGWRVTGTDKFVAGTAQVPSTEGEDTVVWDIPVDLDHTAVTEFDVERSRFLSVTPSAAAVNSLAWQMHRVLYRGGDRGGPAEQVNGFIDFRAALWEVLTNWLTGYVGVKEAGREVVGVNNIGFLSLNWGIGESKSVFQQVTWFGAGRDALYAAQQVGTAKLLELKTWTQQEIPLSIEPQPNPPLSTVKF